MQKGGSIPLLDVSLCNFDLPRRFSDKFDKNEEVLREHDSCAMLLSLVHHRKEMGRPIRDVLYLFSIIPQSSIKNFVWKTSSKHLIFGLEEVSVVCFHECFAYLTPGAEPEMVKVEICEHLKEETRNKRRKLCFEHIGGYL